MTVKTVLIIAGVLVLTACQSNTLPNNIYDAQAQARIRLYGQNQKPTIMKYTSNRKMIKVNVGGSFSGALSSLTRTASNRSIGIPATEMTRHMRDYDGILSKTYYEEYVIPAGQPVSVHNSFQGLANRNVGATKTTIHYQGSCQGNEVQFTPLAGRDYEVVPSHHNATCGVTVLQIAPSGTTETVGFN
ncbi:hypothetical protein [Snodgrassella sp. CFCC 13594]|uniref:hypothetical protein n=1 Tax=Snodgrassella sp. CFCC 13594 TaxID=1775559 RepID=UPI00082DCEDA|nr:hypothetical protein [Snodgrassella sp. CFCC 13594]